MTGKPNPARERRILYEIVADAHDSEERAMGWYYYLDDNLEFPFQAKCIHPRAVSPLKKGETVEVQAFRPPGDSGLALLGGKEVHILKLDSKLRRSGKGAEGITLAAYRDSPLYPRIVRAVDEILANGKVVADL